jgi:hypothetical protein
MGCPVPGSPDNIIYLFCCAFAATIRVRLPLVQQPILVNDRVQEVLMRKQLLAGAMVVALATGMTTSAMAFDRGGAGGFHDGGFHRGGFHRGGFHGHGRHAGIRGFGHGRHPGWSGPRVVGGHGGWDYGPSHYEGVAPFGRLVGPPATGGSTFSVGL